MTHVETDHVHTHVLLKLEREKGSRENIPPSRKNKTEGTQAVQS